MERPGYEEDFRKKLEARDIKPKVDSWNRLEEQLENPGKAHRPTKNWWPGIVATSACLLLFFGFMFQSTSDTELIVEQQQKNIKEDTQLQPSSFETEEGFSESVVTTEVTHAGINETLDEPEPLTRSGNIGLEMNDSKMSETAWMQQEEAEVLLAKQMKELGLADLLLAQDISDEVLWKKLDEVLAQASKLQENSGQVSDAEIDALLLLAAEDISSSRPNQGAAVSAEALLYEVELELEESFRQRVFDLLKQGLDKTRTAVVNSMP